MKGYRTCCAQQLGIGHTYTLPSRPVIDSRISDLYNSEKSKIQQLFDSTDWATLTADYRSSVANHSYFRVKGHITGINLSNMLGAIKIFRGQLVAITDEIIGVSQLLGAHTRAAPPKVYTYRSHNRFQILNDLLEFWTLKK